MPVGTTDSLPLMGGLGWGDRRRGARRPQSPPPDPPPSRGEAFRRRPMCKVLAVLLAPALIGAAPPSPDARLRAIVAPVSAERMKATVAKLVSFGTRHTLSSQTDPKRGIGASLGWTKAQFEGLGLSTVRPCEIFTGARIPQPTA